MFLKASLLAIIVFGFKYDELERGHCPFKPGEIETINMDPEVLNGVWINIFDRKILNEHMKCYSIRFHGFNAFEDFEQEEKPRSTYFEYTTLSTDIPKTLDDLDK